MANVITLNFKDNTNLKKEINKLDDFTDEMKKSLINYLTQANEAIVDKQIASEKTVEQTISYLNKVMGQFNKEVSMFTKKTAHGTNLYLGLHEKGTQIDPSKIAKEMTMKLGVIEKGVEQTYKGLQHDLLVMTQDGVMGAQQAILETIGGMVETIDIESKEWASNLKAALTKGTAGFQTLQRRAKKEVEAQPQFISKSDQSDFNRQMQMVDNQIKNAINGTKTINMTKYFHEMMYRGGQGTQFAGLSKIMNKYRQLDKVYKMQGAGFDKFREDAAMLISLKQAGYTNKELVGKNGFELFKDWTEKDLKNFFDLQQIAKVIKLPGNINNTSQSSLKHGQISIGGAEQTFGGLGKNFSRKFMQNLQEAKNIVAPTHGIKKRFGTQNENYDAHDYGTLTSDEKAMSGFLRTLEADLRKQLESGSDANFKKMSAARQNELIRKKIVQQYGDVYNAFREGKVFVAKDLQEDLIKEEKGSISVSGDKWKAELEKQLKLSLKDSKYKSLNLKKGTTFDSIVSGAQYKELREEVMKNALGVLDPRVLAHKNSLKINPANIITNGIMKDIQWSYSEALHNGSKLIAPGQDERVTTTLVDRKFIEKFAEYVLGKDYAKFNKNHKVDVLKGREHEMGYKTMASDITGITKSLIQERVAEGSSAGQTEEQVITQINKELNKFLKDNGYGSVKAENGKILDNTAVLETINKIKDESLRIQKTEEFLMGWFNTLKAGTAEHFIQQVVDSEGNIKYKKDSKGNFILDSNNNKIPEIRSGIKFNTPAFGYNSYALHNARSYDDVFIKAQRNGQGWGIGGYRGRQSLGLSTGIARSIAGSERDLERIKSLEMVLDSMYSNTTMSSEQYDDLKKMAQKINPLNQPDRSKIGQNNIIDLKELYGMKEMEELGEEDYVGGKITQEAFSKTIEGKIGKIINERNITGDVYVQTPNGDLIYVPSSDSQELGKIAGGTSKKRLEQLTDGDKVQTVVSSDIMMQGSGFGSYINSLLNTYFDDEGNRKQITEKTHEFVQNAQETYYNTVNTSFQKGGMIYDAASHSASTSATYGKSESFNTHEVEQLYQEYKDATDPEDKALLKQKILQATGGITLSKDNLAKMLTTAPELDGEDKKKWKEVNNARLLGMYKALRDKYQQNSAYTFEGDEKIGKWDSKKLASEIASIVDTEREGYNGESLASIVGRYPFSHGEDLKFAGLRVAGNSDVVKIGTGLAKEINADFDGDSILSMLLGFNIKDFREKTKEQIAQIFQEATTASYKIQEVHEKRAQVAAAAQAMAQKKDEEEWAAAGLTLDEQKALKVAAAGQRTAIEAGIAERFGKEKVGQFSNIYQNLHNGLVGMKISSEGNLQGKDSEDAMAALAVSSIFEAVTQEAISSKKILEGGVEGKFFKNYMNNIMKLTSMFDPTKEGDFQQKDFFKILDDLGINAGFKKGEGSSFFASRIGTQIATEMLQFGNRAEAQENLWNLISSSGYNGTKDDFLKILPQFDENGVLNTAEYEKNKDAFENLFTKDVLSGMFTKLNTSLTGKNWQDTWNRVFTAGQNGIFDIATHKADRPGTEKMIDVDAAMEAQMQGMGAFVGSLIEATSALKEFTGALGGSGGGGGGGGIFRSPFDVAKQLGENEKGLINSFNSWSASKITNALNPTNYDNQQYLDKQIKDIIEGKAKYKNDFFGYGSAEELQQAVGGHYLAADAGHVSEDVANVFMQLKKMGLDGKYKSFDAVYNDVQRGAFKGVKGVSTLKGLTETAYRTIYGGKVGKDRVIGYKEKEELLQQALGDLYGDSTLAKQIETGIGQSDMLSTLLNFRGYDKTSSGTETISAGFLGNQGTITRADYSTLLKTDAFGNKKDTFAFFDFKNKDKKAVGVSDVIQGVLNYNNLETMRQLAHQYENFEDFKDLDIYKNLQSSWEYFNPGEKFDGANYFKSLKKADKVEGYVAQGNKLHKLNIDQTSLSRYMKIVDNLMNGNGTLDDYRDEIGRLYSNIPLPGTVDLPGNEYMGKGIGLAKDYLNVQDKIDALNDRKGQIEGNSEAEEKYKKVLEEEIALLQQRKNLIEEAIKADDSKAGIDKDIQDEYQKRADKEAERQAKLDEEARKEAEKEQKQKQLQFNQNLKGYDALLKEKAKLDAELYKVEHQGGNLKNPQATQDYIKELKNQQQSKEAEIQTYLAEHDMSLNPEEVDKIKEEVDNAAHLKQLKTDTGIKVNEYYGFLSDKQLVSASGNVRAQLAEKEDQLKSSSVVTATLTEAEQLEAEIFKNDLKEEIALLERKKELIDDAIAAIDDPKRREAINGEAAMKERAKQARLEEDHLKEYQSLIKTRTVTNKQFMDAAYNTTFAKDPKQQQYFAQNQAELKKQLEEQDRIIKQFEETHGYDNNDKAKKIRDDAAAKSQIEQNNIMARAVQAEKQQGVRGFIGSFGSNFAKSAKQFLMYQTSFNALFQKLRQGLKTVETQVKSMNKSLVDLQIVTGNTKEETMSLLTSYSKLGKQLGATTTEVANAANSWLRQGYEAADVTELVTSSLYLSKLGMIDSAQATQNLTSMLKGFKLEASDAISVVDKLVSVDMKAAASAGGIAEALSQFATTAQLSGLDMDKAIAMATTIMDVSQAAPSSAGNALKTILSRFGNVKAGAFEDMGEGEDGTSINDVERVIKTLGISLKDSKGDLRDFSDVLEDIAEKWASIDEISKNALATAFAGTRQRESFLVLMENMDKYHELIEVSANSEGTAIKKYNAYSDNLEASQKRVAAAWEELGNNVNLQNLMIKINEIIEKLVDILPSLIKWTERIASLRIGAGLGRILGTGLTTGLAGAGSRLSGLGVVGGIKTVASDVTYGGVSLLGKGLKGIGGLQGYKMNQSQTVIQTLISKVTTLQRAIETNTRAVLGNTQAEQQDNQNGTGGSTPIFNSGGYVAAQNLINTQGTTINGTQVLQHTYKNKTYQMDPKTGKMYKVLKNGQLSKWAAPSRVTKDMVQKDSTGTYQNYFNQMRLDQGKTLNKQQINNINSQIASNNKTLQGWTKNDKGQWISKKTGKVANKSWTTRLNNAQASNEQLQAQQQQSEANKAQKGSAAAGVMIQMGAAMAMGGLMGSQNYAKSSTITDSTGQEIQAAMTKEEEATSRKWSTVSGIASGIPIFGPAFSHLYDLSVKNNWGNKYGVSRGLARSEQEAANSKKTLNAITGNLDKFAKAASSGDLDSGKKELDDMISTLYKRDEEGRDVNKTGREQYEKYLKNILGDKFGSNLLEITKNVEGDVAAQRELSQAMLIAQEQANRENFIASNAKENNQRGKAADEAWLKYKDSDYQEKVKAAGNKAGWETGATVGVASAAAVIGVGAAIAGGLSSIPVAGWIAAGATMVVTGVTAGIVAAKEAELKKQAELEAANAERGKTYEDKINEVEAAIDLARTEGDTAAISELQEIKDTLQQIQIEQEQYYKELDESYAKEAVLGMKSADGTFLANFSEAQLKQNIGKNGIEQAFGEYLESIGGLYNSDVFSTDGSLSEYAQSLLKTAIKENSTLNAVYTGNAYTLSEALQKNDTDLLQNFATALGVSVDALSNMEDQFGRIELGDFMSTIDDLNTKMSKLTENITFLTDSTKSQYEKEMMIINQYPELINLMGDTPALLSEFWKDLGQLANVQAEKLIQEIYDQEEYYTKTLLPELQKNEQFSAKFNTVGDELSSVTSITGLMKYLARNGDSDFSSTIQELVAGQLENVDAVVDVYRELFDQMDEYKVHLLDEQLENLNSQKEALEQITAQREYENKLLEARNKLETALNEKKRVWREGVGWVYEADQEAIAAAEEELDSLSTEKQISNLEETIKEIEAEKQRISDRKDAEKWKQQQELFESYFGKGEGSVNSYIQAVQTAVEGIQIDVGGTTGAINEDIENKELARQEALYGAGGSKDNVKGGLAAAKSKLVELSAQLEGKDKLQITNEQRSAYNDALEEYSNLRTQALSNGYISSDDLDYMSTTSMGGTVTDNLYNGGSKVKGQDVFLTNDRNDGSGAYKKYMVGDMTAADSQEAKWVYGDMTEKKKWAHGFLPDGTVIYFWNGMAYSKPGAKDMKAKERLKYELTQYSVGDATDLSSYASKVKNILLIGAHGDQEAVVIKDGNLFTASVNDMSEEEKKLLAGKGGGYYLDGSGTRSGAWGEKGAIVGANALGTLNFAGGPSLINELGTEAIITPHGTITSLPSATGIVPADITKNLWQLGELAPAIAQGLMMPGFGFNSTFGTPANQSAVDESFNITNLTMNVSADDSFDADAFVRAIRTKADLSRNSR